ncbi:hypothetical protein SB776_36115, partial [Burkholderia sp. SIMBA_045]
YEQTADGWQQTYAAPTTESVLWRRQAHSDDELNALCDEAQRSLNLQNGPLMRALLVFSTAGTPLLSTVMSFRRLQRVQVLPA